MLHKTRVSVVDMQVIYAAFLKKLLEDNNVVNKSILHVGIFIPKGYLVSKRVQHSQNVATFISLQKHTQAETFTCSITKKEKEA